MDTEYYYEKSHGAGMRKLFPDIDFPSDKVTPSHGTTADRPTSKLYWSYGIEKEAQLVPKPPEPYETFDEKVVFITSIHK